MPDVKYIIPTHAICETYGNSREALATMELRHLKYFLAVAEERQFTRAAARLFIEQPPLSQQIRALENELGFALFSRLPRGVEPTPAGESFADDVRQALSLLDLVVRKAARIARGELGAVAVGMTSSAAFHPLPLTLVREFRERYHDVAIDLVELNAAEIIERMSRGAIQVAILRKPIDTPDGLAFEPLFDEEMVVVLPDGHRLAQPKLGRAGIRLKDLAGEDFVLVRRPGAPGIYADFLAACRASGFEPRVVQEVPRMAAGINLVAAGLGITVVPASMQRYGQHSVVFRRLAHSTRVSAPLHLAYRAAEPNSAARQLTQLILARAHGKPGDAGQPNPHLAAW